MQHQKTKKLKRKSKIEIVDLPNDGPLTIIPLSAVLSNYVKNKSKHQVKVLNKEGQLDTRWLKDEFPHWQMVWLEKGVNLKWDRRQRSFFLSAFK